MRIVADHEECVGAGVCAMTAPRVFGQDPKDGRVLLLLERPGPDDAGAAQLAVALCPSGALSLEEPGD